MINIDMTPQQQKMDIDKKRSELQSFSKELESRILVLKRAMEAIDKGEDMFNDNSMLATEVQKIMCQRLIDIV